VETQRGAVRRDEHCMIVTLPLDLSRSGEGARPQTVNNR
jgi:hypothetical protein